MKVKELIEILKREPQDADVMLGVTEYVRSHGFVNVDDAGSEYDGTDTYTSKGETLIVLRPNTNHIKDLL